MLGVVIDIPDTSRFNVVPGLLGVVIRQWKYICDRRINCFNAVPGLLGVVIHLPLRLFRCPTLANSPRTIGFRNRQLRSRGGTRTGGFQSSRFTHCWVDICCGVAADDSSRIAGSCHAERKITSIACFEFQCCSRIAGSCHNFARRLRNRFDKVVPGLPVVVIKS